MHDPQQLSLVEKVGALVALGRIPLASETPLWTILGCIIASKTYLPSSTHHSNPPSFDLLAMLQCVLVTWGTNISINYGNDFFDYDMDRPDQLAAMNRDVAKRRAMEGGAGSEKTTDGGNLESASGTALPSPITTATTDESEIELNEKIFGNASRIIHDGTFPPWIALAISGLVQASIIGMVLISRHFDPTLNPSSTSARHTPFKGLVLWIGIFSTILSQEYVGPPLRLHYRSFGEITSALLVSPVSVIWGLTGYYTAMHPAARPIRIDDLFHAPTVGSFGIDKTMWTLLGAMYCFEQARILIMHIHDIDADAVGGKVTLVVRLGYVKAARLYVALNAVGMLLAGALLGRLMQGQGAMLADVGVAASSRSFEAVRKGSAVGVEIVLLYSIPVIALTATSLFASAPNRTGPPASPFGIVPIVPVKQLAKLVSLQMLATPIVLSIAAILAGRA